MSNLVNSTVRFTSFASALLSVISYQIYFVNPDGKQKVQMLMSENVLVFNKFALYSEKYDTKIILL